MITIIKSLRKNSPGCSCLTYHSQQDLVSAETKDVSERDFKAMLLLVQTVNAFSAMARHLTLYPGMPSNNLASNKWRDWGP